MDKTVIIPNHSDTQYSGCVEVELKTFTFTAILRRIHKSNNPPRIDITWTNQRPRNFETIEFNLCKDIIAYEKTIN